MSDDAWTYSEEPFTPPLHIGPCSECGRLRGALAAYHELAPALAECANECGEARLYSDLKQANDGAAAALDGAP